MPTFYMLCGVPGSGKSTWINYNFGTFRPFPSRDAAVISTDDVLEVIGSRYMMTYNEVFDNISYSFAEKLSYKLAARVFADRVPHVVWDQTNLNVKTRKRKLEIVPAGYHKIAVAFDVPNDLQERLESRPGKEIPAKVMQSMLKSYVTPTVEEGFDEVVHVSASVNFKLFDSEAHV